MLLRKLVIAHIYQFKSLQKVQVSTTMTIRTIQFNISIRMSRRDAFHLLPHTKSPTNSALPHSDYPVFAEAFMYHYHCCKAHQIFAVFFTFPATVQCSVVVTRVGAMRWRVRGGCGKMCILINLKIYYKSAPLSSHIISRSRPWMTVANKEGRMGWRMLK